MDSTTTPDPERPTRRPRRVTWALAISAGLHVAFVGAVVRFPAARASAMPPPPLRLDTPPPRIAIVPKPRAPAPTPRPTPRPPRAAASRPLRAAVTRDHVPRSVRVSNVHVRSARVIAAARPGAAASRSAGHGVPATAAGPSDGGGIDLTPSSPPDRLDPTAGPTAPSTKPACSAPDVEARAVSVVQPEESDDAKARGETGTVRVRLELDTGGSVLSATVETASGFRDLDDAALASARASRFAPEVRRCVPVGGTYLFVAAFEQ